MEGFYAICTALLILGNSGTPEVQGTLLNFYTSTTQLPRNSRIVPRGTTVLLECRDTTHQQQIHYNWTCPHPPCDGEYRKVYNNLILIVATAATGGRYKCAPTPHGNEVSATLTVQTSLPQGSLALYNRSKLLLRNTLITDPQQIPNGLVCTTGKDGVPRFRFEGETILHSSRQGQKATAQSSQLNQNGHYVCIDGGREWPFYIYFNNATLPKPEVSTNSSFQASDQQLRLFLRRPEGYTRGRFIVRYNYGFRGIPIELEYRSVEISGSSDVVVTRSRSCFVVGEISRVTVWFVRGRHISSTPAAVNATSGEGSPSSQPTSSPPTLTPTGSSTRTQTSQPRPPATSSGTSTETPGLPVALIAGVSVAAVILLLLLVLLIVMAAVLYVKYKRKTVNNKGQAYSYVTHDTKGENKDLMYDDIVPGGHGPPQDDASIEETHPIPLYTGVDKTSKHNNNTAQAQPHPYEYDDIETPNTAHTVNNTSDRGPLPPGYEDLDAANTPSHTEGKAGTEETPPEGGHVGDLYAVPDKSKKKNKEKNKAASENPPAPPHYEPTADGEAGFDPNMLYAVVDKSQKKKK